MLIAARLPEYLHIEENIKINLQQHRVWKYYQIK
jgi:hypothetical protein